MDTKIQRKMVAKYLLKDLKQKKEIIFVDEFGSHYHSRPNYGYAISGAKPYIQDLPKSKNYSVIMVMDQLGIIGFTVFDGSCKSTDFMGFMYNYDRKRS